MNEHTGEVVTEGSIRFMNRTKDRFVPMGIYLVLLPVGSSSLTTVPSVHLLPKVPSYRKCFSLDVLCPLIIPQALRTS